jgi:histidinol-phosphatase
MLAKTCPDDTILGEEFGGDGALDQERSWILDPIDGTQAFALGLPTFGVLIAYAERGEPLLGVMSFPALGYDVYAARNAGCFMRAHDGEAAIALRASGAKQLGLAQVSATSLQQSSAVMEGGLNLSGIVTAARRFRFVGDCVQHALVCMGRLDAAIDLIVAPWDVAAVIPCVEEAGGVVADAAGHRGKIVSAGSLISASSVELKTEIANALQAR